MNEQQHLQMEVAGRLVGYAARIAAIIDAEILTDPAICQQLTAMFGEVNGHCSAPMQAVNNAIADALRPAISEVAH